ncbi:hypothetical protein [Actibacterium sp. 188UL27-1]|uniref:hypothetical protein n=1 Tax=Actibacterium sp. 188UL27-1 TaxID=2786961 RepID=UPI001EF60406|nr:hypothetical protein [Actibacterium sp. 188UL27-1]
MQFLSAVDPMQLKHNILCHAKTVKALDIPAVMGTSWPQGPNGPTMPELKALFHELDVIDRPFVNFWNDAESKAAIEATGRKKLVISGLPPRFALPFPHFPLCVKAIRFM